MNGKLFLFFAVYSTSQCMGADGAKQRAFDEQVVQSGSGFIGWVTRLLSPDAAAEHAQAQRRLSEDKPEMPSGSGLVLARTPQERRIFIEKSTTDKAKRAEE